MEDEPELEAGAADAAPAQPATPGEKLRAAREAKGLSLPDVATLTRIAQRQLEAIERDDYAALPGIPYAVGFSRAFARAVDLDDVAIAAEVRRAVHASDLGTHRYEAFEPADPARVPSRTLAWTAAAIVIVVAAAWAIWRTQMLTPPTTEQIADEQASPVATPAHPAQGAGVNPATQPVIFAAVDDVWLRIYDEAGERLKDGLLKKGESFTLPASARNPMILTGRPQSLHVTVGGRTVPPLGDPDRTIADVPVSAGALLARISAAASVAAPAAQPTGPVGATPAPASPSGAASSVFRRPSQARSTTRERESDNGVPGASSPSSIPGPLTPTPSTPAPITSSSTPPPTSTGTPPSGN